MIDPILFTINLGSIQLPIRWYGLLIVSGSLAGAYYAAWYVKHRKQDPDMVWDVMIWLLVSGILGARVWYVVNDLIGGNTRYLENPAQIPQIWQGGLNILGGIVIAALVGWYYTKKHNIDFWLIADATGPALLLGQAIGRWGNFINQELYGPPTTLPWGIPIDASHRLAPWNDLSQFPLDTTRFHPTFAYEMIWNLIFFGLIVYAVIKLGDRLKPGLLTASWLMISGVGRAWIEIFRPDQPRFFNTAVSTSTLISLAFAIIGLVLYLAKIGKIQLPFIAPAGDDYTRPQPVRREIRRRAKK